MASPRRPIAPPPVKPQAKLGPVQKSSGKASTGVVGVASRGAPQVAGKLDPTKKVNVAKAGGAPQVSKKVAAQNQARIMADMAKMPEAKQALAKRNAAQNQASMAKLAGANKAAVKMDAASKAALEKAVMQKPTKMDASKMAVARKASLGMAKGGLVKSTGKLKTGIKGCK